MPHRFPNLTHDGSLASLLEEWIILELRGADTGGIVKTIDPYVGSLENVGQDIIGDITDVSLTPTIRTHVAARSGEQLDGEGNHMYFLRVIVFSAVVNGRGNGIPRFGVNESGNKEYGTNWVEQFVVRTLMNVRAVVDDGTNATHKPIFVSTGVMHETATEVIVRTEFDYTVIPSP